MGVETIPDPCGTDCCSPPPPPPPGGCAPCSAPITFTQIRVSMHITATGLTLGGNCGSGPTLPDLPAQDFTADANVSVSSSVYFSASLFEFNAYFTPVDPRPSSAAMVIVRQNTTTGGTTYECLSGFTVGPYINPMYFRVNTSTCVSDGSYQSQQVASLPTAPPPPPSTTSKDTAVYLKYDASTNATPLGTPLDWQLDSYTCNGTTCSGTFTLYGRIPTNVLNHDYVFGDGSGGADTSGATTYGVVGYGSFVSL